MFAFNQALVYWRNHRSETDFVFYEMCSIHEWLSQILAVSTISNKNIWIKIDFFISHHNNNFHSGTEHWTSNIEYCSIMWDLFKLKFPHHFTELFSKNPWMRTEICCTTSLDEHLSSWANENQNRARSPIYQEIEQVMLYKTWYTTNHPNSEGLDKFSEVVNRLSSQKKRRFAELNYLISIWLNRAEHGLSEYV